LPKFDWNAARRTGIYAVEHLPDGEAVFWGRGIDLRCRFVFGHIFKTLK
jgi:hypothetical protein